MALTPEQIAAYRQKYGLDQPASTTAPAPDVAQERIQRLKQAAETPAPSMSVTGATPPAQGVSVQQPQKKNIFGAAVDLGKDIAKDAIGTLLVKPAARTAEAIGRTGLLGKDIQRGYEVMNDEGGQELETPVGSYKVSSVKGGTEGAGQIAGEALKVGSYLYGGQGLGAAKTALGTSRAGTAITTAMKAGGVSGAMYGGGDALEQGKDAGEVLKDTLVGGAIGTVAGGAIAAVPPVVKGTIGLTKATFGGAKRAVNALDDVGARSAQLATRAPAAKKAIESGVDDSIVNFVETATPDDHKAFREMFQIAEKTGADPRFRHITQPKQVAGRTILDRASHLIKTKDLGVAQTNKVLNSLDQNPVDASNILFTFLNDLKEKGVTVVKRGKGYQFINQGAVPDGDLGAYQTMLKILAPDENGSVMRSYRGLHTGRQRIFNELNLAKARQQTFSDDVVRYADRFRSMLLEPIDKASGGKYKVAQQKTAETLGALREFVQLMGYKGDLEKLTTKDLKAAEVASRVLGNAADRPLSVLNQLDDVARKYGYNGKGNILDQIDFADLLDDVFGTTQTRSMRGQVGRGTLDAISETTGALHEGATGNVLALGSRALKAVLGKGKDQQIKALSELLESLAGNGPKSNFGKASATVRTATPKVNTPSPKKPVVPKITN